MPSSASGSRKSSRCSGAGSARIFCCKPERRPSTAPYARPSSNGIPVWRTTITNQTKQLSPHNCPTLPHAPQEAAKVRPLMQISGMNAWAVPTADGGQQVALTTPDGLTIYGRIVGPQGEDISAALLATTPTVTPEASPLGWGARHHVCNTGNAGRSANGDELDAVSHSSGADASGLRRTGSSAASSAAGTPRPCRRQHSATAGNYRAAGPASLSATGPAAAARIGRIGECHGRSEGVECRTVDAAGQRLFHVVPNQPAKAGITARLCLRRSDMPTLCMVVRSSVAAHQGQQHRSARDPDANPFRPSVRHRGLNHAPGRHSNNAARTVALHHRLRQTGSKGRSEGLRQARHRRVAP